MSDLLYIKYNSHRRPEYQLSTRIVSENGPKRVIKLPLNELASRQIAAIKDNYSKLKGYYKNIKPIPYAEYGDGISFEYIEGTPILKGIDLKKEKIKLVSEYILHAMDEILSIDEKYITEFEETAEFKKVFPDRHPTGRAFKVCNLDSIFSNFIRTDEGIVCIDYEWVLDFPIPVDYIKCRMLHYYYEENEAYLRDRISRQEWFGMIGLSEEEVQLYSDMERDFQYLIHGENVRYIYLERYKKRMITAEKAYQLIDAKDNHIGNLERNIEAKDEIINALREDNDVLKNNLDKCLSDLDVHSKELEEQINKVRELSDRLNRIKRGIKNPFYGLYLAGRYIKTRLNNRISYIRTKHSVNKENKRLERKAELDRQRYEELSRIVDGDYEYWIQSRESEYKRDEIFEYNPLISIIVPVYNVEDRHLIPCIESVKQQTYKNWELILVDDHSFYPNVARTLRNKSRWSKKLQVITREDNGGISSCTNTGINAAMGEYIAFMDCDDTIAPFALYEVVRKLNEDEYDFIYSDEDKIDDDGSRRHDPFFKPDWSPDTLMSYMYTSHLGVYKTSIVKELGGLNSEYDGCQDYDLTLRFTEKTQRIGHIPMILYHWREREESTASDPESKSYVRERTLDCKRAALKRRGLEADLEWMQDIYQYRVRYIPSDGPLVSIIIPSKDNPEILEQCLRSLREKTDYSNYEITIVDNGSSDINRGIYEELSAKYRCRYHYEKRDFNFSYMCNTGARISKGEYFVFLNDDIEISDGEWLDRMLGQAELPHVGAVGAKLLYPGTSLIQHAGVISIESGPVHEFARMDDKENYYFNRNRLDFDVLAVTAACLLIKKDRFDEIGGYDEELVVAYNDIDLCMKLVEAGYYNVIRNDAVLYHHESISRGNDAIDPAKFKRLMDEQEKLYSRHPQYRRKDPFYNVNLVQTDCDFSNDYESENDYTVKQISSSDLDNLETDETIRYGIDIARHDWCTYIEGWAFKEGYDDNINLETQLLLKGENKSYLINTARVRREDVVETFSDENCISFCGFKIRIDRHAIASGAYQIRVICNERLAETVYENEGSIGSVELM